MQKRSAIAQFLLFGALSAGSLHAALPAPEPCPTDPGPGPVEGRILVRAFSAQRVNAAAGLIVGKALASHTTIRTIVCARALVEGRRSLNSIQPGDEVMTREFRDATGRFVATDVSVNVTTFNAQIISTTPNALRFVLLDYHTGEPMSRWTNGAIPRTILTNGATRVEYRGASHRSAFLRHGDDVKVYGYKPPTSNVVSAYLIEIYRRPSL